MSEVRSVVLGFRACIVDIHGLVIHLARAKLLSALAFDVYDELARYHVHEHVAGVVMPTAHPAHWKLDPEDCAFEKEGTVLRIELPVGWVAGRHYHTGDVFVCVISGEFVVDVEGQGRQQFRPGEVYHEAVNTTMQARNPSTTERTSLILFQIGGKGEPLMLVAKPPRR